VEERNLVAALSGYLLGYFPITVLRIILIRFLLYQFR
jgi:hypothetical protein